MELSLREKEVVKLMCLGYMDKEISEIMNISSRTVQTYVERTMYKLHARNRLAMIATYVREYEKL